MAYLAKEQSLKQWGELVTDLEVANMNQIQNVQFISKMLLNLDFEYFSKIMKSHHEGTPLSQIVAEIRKYYLQQLGTNIDQILNQNVNIYSSSTIEDIWELVLGIAIKGKNRQKNINTILRMRTQTQQELMRIISKLINKLGQNVSVIEASASQNNNSSSYNYSNEANIIIQLSEQNEQLRQKVEQLSTQINIINEKYKNVRAELENRNSERKQIINLMIKEPISSKHSFIYESTTSTDSIIEFIKDLMAQVTYATKQLSKKEEKIGLVQDLNKDLKLAYSTIFLQLDEMKNQTKQSHVDFQQVEKKIEFLQEQNLQYAERQKNLIVKITQLEEQKYRMKEIIQRLESRNMISQEKIDKFLVVNKVIRQNLFEKKGEQEQGKPENNNYLNFSQGSNFRSQSSIHRSQIESQERKKTVRREMEDMKQPNLKNKYQKQISHLQKKLNLAQQKSESLAKINTILEKVVNQFTTESKTIIDQYNSEIQPLFQQFSTVLEQEQQKRAALESEVNLWEEESAKRIKQMLQKMKEKVEEYDAKQIEYQKMIKKLQIEKEQLLKVIKHYDEKSLQSKIVEKIEKKSSAFGFSKAQLQIKPERAIKFPVQKQFNFHPAADKIEEKVQQQIVKQKKSQISASDSQAPSSSSQPEYKITLPKNDQIQNEGKVKKSDETNFLRVQSTKNAQIAASILVEDDQQQTQVRRRQYSFMGNRQSTYQFAQDSELLGFKENNNQFNKLSVIGSFIKEDVRDREESSSQTNTENHIQIVDITQIEEQLVKIKQHYIGITIKSKQMCESIIERASKDTKVIQKSKDNQIEVEKEKRGSQISVVLSNFEKLTEKNRQDQSLYRETVDQYIKSMQQSGIQKSKLKIENIQLKQQNNYLKKLAMQLKRQREMVEERLTYFHHQSSKSQEQRTKDELTRLGSTISEIRTIMIDSQSSYLNLEQFVIKSMGEGDKAIGTLKQEIQKLRQEIMKKDILITQFELQTNLLISATLEFRNNAIRN